MQTNRSISGNPHNSHNTPPSTRAASINHQEEVADEKAIPVAPHSTATAPEVVAEAFQEPADIAMAAPELKMAVAEVLSQISGIRDAGLGDMVSKLRRPHSQEQPHLGDGSSKSPASGLQVGQGQSRSPAFEVNLEVLPIICEKGIATISSVWSKIRPCS